MPVDADPHIPDPNGPPQTSIYVLIALKRLGTAGVLTVFSGAAALWILSLAPTRTMGALRSQRIKWQQRQQQIAEVQAESDRATIGNGAQETARKDASDNQEEPTHD